MTGTPRPLGADAALTAFRTAQEALTNARKHAPGQPVSLTLSYPSDGMTLLVSNPLPAPDGAAPLARGRGRLRADRAAGTGGAGRRHADLGAVRRPVGGLPAAARADEHGLTSAA